MQKLVVYLDVKEKKRFCDLNKKLGKKNKTLLIYLIDFYESHNSSQ